MPLARRYKPAKVERALRTCWQEEGNYRFARDGRPVYAIDTPPPTVSGLLHLGHVYSYSQTDFIARYRRMIGDDVLYPMGYDDNGLPTERLVEKTIGVRATDIGRQAFIEKCLQISEETERNYQELWERLGLSVDWQNTYRTIDDDSRRLSQLSFLDLYQKGLAYRRRAPAIWCPECQTAIAQAELDDLERESEFVTVPFKLDDASTLLVATTRPELLPACVALFVHPEDDRYRQLVGRQATVPLFGQAVRVLDDPAAEPDKGTGAVMCCTFGDTSDVAWWYTYNLDLVEAVGRDGRLTSAAGDFAGQTVPGARELIKQALSERQLLTERYPTTQSLRVHERCDTPVEYVVAAQWFVRVMEYKEALLAAGERVRWYPAQMKNRYKQWVDNLNWDWCISRQRYFGVPFPIWFCDECGEIITAEPSALPVDPADASPSGPCICDNTRFRPETDVMDTWATSSITPQRVGQLVGASGFDGQRFEPLSLRPQAHEIIRTWAFYSLVKAYHHFGIRPWNEVAISGWGLAPEGTGKISKSRGGGPISPLEMIERYSADAVRYWAASSGLGKDAVISEKKIQSGSKLVTKLWNVARFSQRFLADYRPPTSPPTLLLSDRWILSRLHEVIASASEHFAELDYAAAKSIVENFFWTDLADNYLEMIKKRLYDSAEIVNGIEASAGARYALYHALLATIKLLAPILPYVTEEIYRGLFEVNDNPASIHISDWPTAEPHWVDKQASQIGQALLSIATAVRRYKSHSNLSLGAEIARLHVAVDDLAVGQALQEARTDIRSVTRARVVTISARPDPTLLIISAEGALSVGLLPVE